jgi:hypothetical protein
MIQKQKLGLLVVLLLSAYMPMQAQTFGRYADCTTGRGICGVQTENIGDEGPLRVGSQKFFIRPKTDSTVELVLVKANITSADEHKIFGSSLAALPQKKPSYVYIDNAVPLTESQRGLLGMANRYSAVAPGVYAVVVTETFFISELKLQ